MLTRKSTETEFDRDGNLVAPVHSLRLGPNFDYTNPAFTVVKFETGPAAATSYKNMVEATK